MGFPDPLDFVVFVFEVGHIVDRVAHLDDGFDIFLGCNLRVSITMAQCLARSRFGTFANAGLRPM
jgi:hypothetical protein